MENIPEVTRCFGIFPAKYATYLISLVGLGMGGCGLSGIVLYGLIEKAITAFLFHNSKVAVDDSVKKCILFTIGLSSLLLTIACTLMFLGATSGNSGPITVSVWIIFAMILIVLSLCISAPLSCFFMDTLCVVKKLSMGSIIFLFLIVTAFLELWIYFMLVANTYVMEIKC